MCVLGTLTSFGECFSVILKLLKNKKFKENKANPALIMYIFLYNLKLLQHFTSKCFTMYLLLLFFLRLYLLFSERGKEKGRKIPMCGCLSRAPYWGPGPQPRLVPCVGIKPATLWFAGRCSIHWATPARAQSDFKITSLKETLKWS